MRKLALFTTTATLAAGALGASASASPRIHHSHRKSNAENTSNITHTLGAALAAGPLQAPFTAPVGVTAVASAGRARPLHAMSSHAPRSVRAALIASMESHAIGNFLESGLSAAEPLALELVVGTRGRRISLGPDVRRHAARLVQSLVAASSGGGAPGAWLALRTCESGNNYGADTGNGYYGAYQFSASTWWWMGFSGLPDQASAAIQDHAARSLEARVGWSAWPQCSATLGLR